MARAKYKITVITEYSRSRDREGVFDTEIHHDSRSFNSYDAAVGRMFQEYDLNNMDEIDEGWYDHDWSGINHHMHGHCYMRSKIIIE